MYRFSTYKQQYKANLKLALPVVMTQLGPVSEPTAATTKPIAAMTEPVQAAGLLPWW